MFANRKTAVAVASALLALTGSGWAQTPARNDLLTIYRDAVQYDSVFASARFARQAAEEREPQARSAVLPNVNLGLGASETYVDFSASAPYGYSRSFNAWGPSLSLTMPLYRPQNWEAISQAKLAVVSAEATLSQARQDLILRVAQAYFDVLGAQDTLAAILESKKGTTEQLAQAKREFEVGTKTIVDTHEAQARFDQTVAQEQTARGDLVVKQNALRVIIGRDPGRLAPLRDAPELVAPKPNDVEAWAKQAEASNFGVAVAQASAEIAQRETKRQRAASLPTVDLTASVAQNRQSGSSTSGVSGDVRSGTIGVQLNYPLYTGGLIQSRIREALANEEKAKQDLESARRTATQAARQAYTGVDFGLAQVRALESAEVSAKSQLESTRLGYRVGVRINLDVLNAETQLFSTQRDLKKSRYDFLVNGLRLQSAAGALGERDLETINALLAR
jgi:outer membrane protein